MMHPSPSNRPSAKEIVDKCKKQNLLEMENSTRNQYSQPCVIETSQENINKLKTLLRSLNNSTDKDSIEQITELLFGAKNI